MAQRTIRAPQAGVVSKIFFQAGEPAEKLVPVVEVVTLDPLWIEFDCPVDQSAGLAIGSKLSVRRAVMGEESRSATVIFTSMTADASSHSTRVRLELPNDPPWRAGLQIWIEAKATAKPPRGK